MGPTEPSTWASDTISLRDGELLLNLARVAVGAAFQPTREASEHFHEEGALRRPGAVFVTLRGDDGRLRGCIGTLSPKYKSIAEETWRMSREAAFSDSRFPPVRAQELPRLRFEVSLLGPMEEVTDLETLDPRRYGVVVSTDDGRRGALLPAVEGVDTVETQLAIARRKGGIRPGEPIRVKRFVTWHFAETRKQASTDSRHCTGFEPLT
jgi:AmmeMemoRadiSam system protein A